MSAHIRACLWLLVLTVIICCGIYPLALWAVGKTLFPNQAGGSLIYDKEGKAIGSRLIAQEFKSDEFFQSRPSAAGYNGAASGATNWGANNYLLRDRVARSVATLVSYRSGPSKGKPVAPDVVKWFREQPDVAATWAKDHSGLAQSWVKSDDAAKDFVKSWFEKHTAELEAWKKENKDNTDPKPEDLAVAFFESFAKENPGTWLSVDEGKEKDKDGKPIKFVRTVKKTDEDSADIASVFFDAWRAQHADADLEPVPADMVMASSSGLDPHLTLESALYQLDRVAGKWAELTKQDAAKVRSEIETILKKKKEAPLGGLFGVDLINVLEVNIALREKFGPSVPAAK
jgi:K+-transporting ATPase ATPase C chain